MGIKNKAIFKKYMHYLYLFMFTDLISLGTEFLWQEGHTAHATSAEAILTGSNI